MKTQNKQKVPYVWIAPIITLGIMLTLYAMAGVYPFGTKTMAVGDGLAQYLPFLSEFVYKIKEGSSLFFSWHAGRGINFWANFAYYLSSPFNIIALFFNSENMADAFSLITLIKPVFAALTFSIFLKKVYLKNDISIVIFSTLWSLSAFVFAITYLATWIDAIIYFPLVVASLKMLMDGESGWKYSLFLGLAIASNFYFGYMICIFCIIYFIYYFISNEEIVYEGVSVASESDENEDGTVNIFSLFKNSYLIKTSIRFMFFSLLGGALTAVLSVPTAVALSGTGKGTTENTTFMVNDIWNVLVSHILPLKNIYPTLVSNDILFCFVGLLTPVLVISYFFTKGISIRKKIGNLFLLVVMWLSIIFFDVYIVWHAFSIPAGIMQRFAFIYAFILLKIAYEAFVNIDKTNIVGILLGTAFSALCMIGIRKSKVAFANFFSLKLVAVIAIFVIAYLTIFVLMMRYEKLRRALSVIILVLVVSEIVILSKDNLSCRDWGSTITDGKIVEKMEADNETGEYTLLQINKQEFRDNIMYGLLYNYNSNDYYSSLADYQYILTQNFLGSYGNGLNLENGALEQTPIVNIMLPVKYFIDGEGNVSENQFRKKLKTIDGYNMFENQYTMPFMYVISKNVENWRALSYPVPTDMQNSLFKAYTGVNKDTIIYNTNDNFVFDNCYQGSYLETVKEQADAENLKWHDTNNEYFNALEKKMATYTVNFKDKNKDAYVNFDSIAQSDGIQYIFVDTNEFTDLKITANGKTKSYYTYGIGESRMYEIGTVKKGDVINISIGGHKIDEQSETVYANTGEIFSAICFTVDMDAFVDGYERLDSMSDTELLEFEDTYVKAKVTSYEDGVLYIPTANDGGWTVTIDGEAASIYDHESHILMADITKGEHIVEMKYCPQGFKAGAAITGVSLIVLIAWAVIDKKRSKKESVVEE